MEPIIKQILIPTIGLLISITLLWTAFRSERHRRLTTDLPTTPTKGVFIGMVSLLGTAESNAPLRSRVTNKTCVTYSWTIHERWSRQVTDTTTDTNGKQHTTTRLETGWTPVAGGTQRKPFYLKDDHGSVRVNPEGADLHTKSFADFECGPSDPAFFLGPPELVVDSDGIRRVSEDGIPLHASVRVIGFARERDDLVAPEIVRDDGQELFLISVRSPRGINVGYALSSFWSVVGAFLVAPSALWFRADSLGVQTRFLDQLLLVTPWFGTVLFIGFTLTAFNSLRSLSQKVQRGRANVDVQLKRRNDLIPNLVEVTEGYAVREREIHTGIAKLRAAAIATDDPGPLRPTLVALAESYPTLSADTTFAELRRALSDTEERIALARAYHQDITTAFNTRLRIFPDALIARVAGLKPEPLFELGDYERAVEVVDFAA